MDGKLFAGVFLAVAISTSGIALAHSPGQAGGMRHGSGSMMHHDQGQGGMPMHGGRHHGDGGQMTTGPGAMGHGLMGRHHMGDGHVGRRMTGHGYKRKRHHRGGQMRVRPAQHLTVDDVSHHFGHYLEQQGNERLKLGKVEQKDDNTITADIVTVDDSLVRRFEVDRHSGLVR
jgi:hypothetical protein